MNTIFLSRKDVKSLLNMPKVIKSIEQVFIDWHNDKAVMPPKAYVSLKKGDFRAMPAAVPKAAGMKWVNVHTGNHSLGLPTVMAILILNDPDTGFPLAVMDGTEITAFRTGATAAVASKYLARENSKVLGIIGAGYQAYTQTLAHKAVFNLSKIKVFDINEENSLRLKNTLAGLPIEICTLNEAVNCDILCTLTPSRKPIIPYNLLKPGTHINAVGADAPGKQELELEVIQNGKVIVDDYTQSIKAGEINVPIAAGDYKKESIFGTLSAVISGEINARNNGKEITIFDSTGVAIEDIVISKLVYDEAKIHPRNYPAVDFIS